MESWWYGLLVENLKGAFVDLVLPIGQASGFVVLGQDVVRQDVQLFIIGGFMEATVARQSRHLFQ